MIRMIEYFEPFDLDKHSLPEVIKSVNDYLAMPHLAPAHVIIGSIALTILVTNAEQWSCEEKLVPLGEVPCIKIGIDKNNFIRIVKLIKQPLRIFFKVRFRIIKEKE